MVDCQSFVDCGKLLSRGWPDRVVARLVTMERAKT
jgi:hypothetical protein